MSKEWKYIKAKELFENISLKGYEDEEVLAVTQDRGVVYRDDCGIDIKFNEGNKKTYKLVESGDFVISLRSFQGGIEYSNIRGIVSPAYTILKNKVQIDEEFYKYYFKSDELISKLNRAVIGIRDGKQISYNVFKDIEIPNPPLKEQKKIAKIISTVDEHLINIENHINNLTKLKSGLAKKLLIEGVGHTEFKDSEVGRIPVSWGVATLNDIAEIKTGGTPSRKEDNYWNGNIPWMSSGEVNKLEVYATNEYITEEGLENSNTTMLPVDTIMMAMNGQGKTRGTVAMLKIEAACNQSLAGIIVTDEWAEYIFYYLQNMYDSIRGITGDGGRNGLNLALIRAIKVAIPEKSEQKDIANILKTLDNQIRNYQNLKSDYTQLKQGLMQQLLTGKIRVRVDN